MRHDTPIPSFRQGMARSAVEAEHPELWQGLRALWVPGAGVTGNTLYDLSGFRNNGTLTSVTAATAWVNKIGYRGLEPTTSGYVTTTFTPVIAGQPVSMCLWFSLASVGPDYKMLATSDDNPGNAGITIAADNSGRIYGAIGQTYRTMSTVHAANKIYFAVVTGVLNSGSLETYVDGVRATGPSGSPTGGTAGSTLTIGRRVSSPNPADVTVYCCAVHYGEWSQAAIRHAFDIGPMGIIEPRRREWLYVPGGGGEIFRSSVFHCRLVRGAI